MYAVRRSVAPAARFVAAPTVRTFVAYAPRQAGVADTIKQAAQKVNKAAGDAVLGTINAGEKVADAAQPVVDQAKEAAAPLAGKAKDAAEDVKTAANQKGGDAKTTAENAANSLKNEASKAGEAVKGEAEKQKSKL